MLLLKSSYIYEKLLIIAKKFNLICYTEHSFKLEQNNFNKNRVYFILHDLYTNNNIYNNLNYIKKNLKIKILLLFNNNIYIKELIYGYDFGNNLYKIYITVLINNNEKIYAYEFNNNKVIPRIYIMKYEKKNLSKKYKFLKKYEKYITFKNFNFYYKRIKNNKIDSIHFKYNIDINPYILKDLFEKICDNLKWEKKIY